MFVITILLIASICVAAGFLVMYLWASRSGQYDDMHTPAIRMLFEDRKAANE